MDQTSSCFHRRADIHWSEEISVWGIWPFKPAVDALHTTCRDARPKRCPYIEVAAQQMILGRRVVALCLRQVGRLTPMRMPRWRHALTVIKEGVVIAPRPEENQIKRGVGISRLRTLISASVDFSVYCVTAILICAAFCFLSCCLRSQRSNAIIHIMLVSPADVSDSSPPSKVACNSKTNETKSVTSWPVF